MLCKLGHCHLIGVCLTDNAACCCSAEPGLPKTCSKTSQEGWAWEEAQGRG